MTTAELQPRRLFHDLEQDQSQQTSLTAHSLSPASSIVRTTNASRTSRGSKSRKSSKRRRRRIRGAFLWFLLVVLGCCSVGLLLKTISHQQHDEALMLFTPTHPLHYSKSGNNTSNQHQSSSSFISSKDTRYEHEVPPLLPPTVISSSSATRKNSTTDNDGDAAAASVDHAWLHHKLPANDLATLRNDCATLRYRRRRYPNSTAATNNNNITRIGLEFLEYVDGFTSLHHGNFHFYHWLEFVVVAFIQLQQLDLPNVVWIHVPHFTASQFCGIATETTATSGNTGITNLNLNCLLARMALGHSSSSSSSSEQESISADVETNANNNLHSSSTTFLQFYGLEANNYETAISHPKLRATPETPSGLSQWLPFFFAQDDLHQQVVVDAAEQERRHAAMMHELDAVLTIQRPGCVALQNQHKKMWMHHMDHFDADQWHAKVADFQRLLLSPPRESSSPILRIGYIDRQNTGRRLPAAFHKLLLAHFHHLAERHDRVEFLHLHMERLSPVEQIRTAASLHILVGMHGNGLTHQFWMKPRSVVLELFWGSPFQLDYATSAQMMQHDYLCLYNGLPVDAQRIANRDASLKAELTAQQNVVVGDEEQRRERISTGTRVAAQFLEEAVTRWLESNPS